jgi:hypothetical protein
MVQLAQMGLDQRLSALRQRPDVAERLVVIEGFEVVLQQFAADRDSLLDDERRLGRRQCIPFDCIRGVGQLEIVGVLEVIKASAELRPQPVELGFFCGDPGRHLVHSILSTVAEGRRHHLGKVATLYNALPLFSAKNRSPRAISAAPAR